jgi:DNA-binding response OmpR family regulator
MVANQSRPEKAKILVIDDEVDICAILTEAFEPFSTVEVAYDGDSGFQKANALCPEIVVLDLNLPKHDGAWVCEQIQKTSSLADTSVFIISARHELENKIKLFGLGAFDYLEKPFKVPELTARIQANLVRRKKIELGVKAVGNLKLYPDSGEVAVNGVGVHLNNIEFKLVSMLIVSVGTILTKKKICEEIWPGGTLSGGALHVHICSLRKKLKDCDYELKNLHGVGYILRPNETPKDGQSRV